MRVKILAVGLVAAGAVLAGGSFLTARADALNPTFHIHEESYGSRTGTATCTGHNNNTGNAEVINGTSKVRYKANGNGTLQVLGGSLCCNRDDSACSPKFVGQWAEDLGSEWTSSRSWVAKHNCPGSSRPFAHYPKCIVADP
jgi:hypothetical protein